MQLSKNTSSGISKSFFVLLILIFVIIISAILLMDKVDYPSPNKEIKKNLPNEKLKVIK